MRGRTFPRRTIDSLLCCASAFRVCREAGLRQICSYDIDPLRARMRLGVHASGSQSDADAARRLERARLSSRIARHRLLLPGDAPGKRRYDLVFSNSLLHHLADPSVLWATVKSWTRLGGAIFVMDLLRPASRDDARKLVDEHAGGEPDVLRTDFYNSLLAAYRPDEVRSQLLGAGLGNVALEVVSDRHWIAWGRVSAAEEKAKSKL
jgi:hypothetical protein